MPNPATSAGPQTVADLMSTEIVAISPDATLRQLVELLAAHGVSGVPVMRASHVVGVVSATDLLDFTAVTPAVPADRRDQMEFGEWDMPDEREEVSEPPAAYFIDSWIDAGADVVERFAAVNGPEWDVLGEHTVSEIMTQQVCTLPPDTDLAAAARYMLTQGVHRVLVVGPAGLEGIVSTFDFLRAIAGPPGSDAG